MEMIYSGLAYEADKLYERAYELTQIKNGLIIQYDEIVQRISVELDISECFDGADYHRIKKAVWDTGATISVISEPLARRFGLRSVSNGIVVTAMGQMEMPIFELDIHLTKELTIPRLRVFGSPMKNRDVDFLIGMDIISRGKLTTDSRDGKTRVIFEI